MGSKPNESPTSGAYKVQTQSADTVSLVLNTVQEGNMSKDPLMYNITSTTIFVIGLVRPAITQFLSKTGHWLSKHLVGCFF